MRKHKKNFYTLTGMLREGVFNCALCGKTTRFYGQRINWAWRSSSKNHECGLPSNNSDMDKLFCTRSHMRVWEKIFLENEDSKTARNERWKLAVQQAHEDYQKMNAGGDKRGCRAGG